MFKNLKNIYTNPCVIFECENFLNNNLYFDLKKTFEKINEPSEFTDFKNGKFAFSSDDEKYNEFILKNKAAYDFHYLIFNKNFFNFFFKKYFIDFVKSRLGHPRHILKLLRAPKIKKKINKQNLNYYFSIFTPYKIDIQYSMINNNGKIVPHTDSGEKLLTLMIYFPDNDSNIEEQYGTSFWDSAFSNFNNLHQKDHLEFKFKNKAKIFYKSKFKPNTMVGFIKNSSSWHSVEPLDVNKNYVRKSININISF